MACEALIIVAAAVRAKAVPARAARSALPRLRRRCLPRCFIDPPEAGQLRLLISRLTEEQVGWPVRGMLRQGSGARDEYLTHMPKSQPAPPRTPV
ncbi:hypothetical protein GCM10027072_06580 [Streptomyces bullii]